MRVSSCCGHALQTTGKRWQPLLALLTMLGVSACASLPTMPNAARDQLDFMAQAMTSSPAERESIWQSVRAVNGSERNELRVDLMQSIPGHSGYDVVAAQRRLRGFISHSASPDLVAVARARLAEISAATSCREEVQDLRRRMTMMVDIEKQQGQ